VINVGVFEEPVTVAGQCHQEQSVLDALSMQQRAAVQCARPVLQPPVRMMPPSMHASVRTITIATVSQCLISLLFGEF